jgi:predicted MFS family arabinose efflux permease
LNTLRAQVTADHPYRSALALALGAAVSLGLARFSYALLLPPMRADLQWSYFTAGAMNTANAAGYLIGALMAPRWLAQHDPRRVFLGGIFGAMVLLLLHAFANSDAMLLGLRLGTGIASAATFVGGGLIAARLGATTSSPRLASLVLGIYYGGTGAGIVASALVVPVAASAASWTSSGPWRGAWVLLALVAGGALVLAALGTRGHASLAGGATAHAAFDWRRLRFGLLSYLMFGLGYIGYMTFIIMLLREQGASELVTILFYIVLGLAVMLSPWIWAGLLQRHRGGLPIAVLNGLLAMATALPMIGNGHLVPVFASGALFGAVFLSLVASTTAMVRHNLEPASWSRGIAAFTIVFAFGQIVGPGLVGWIADGSGGLVRGFLVSAALLALGSAIGLLQRPLITR